ncbi:hypothetical protein CONCODRAFT_168622, partial [Conidiobolus coronatus NRRL 28638]
GQQPAAPAQEKQLTQSQSTEVQAPSAAQQQTIQLPIASAQQQPQSTGTQAPPTAGNFPTNPSNPKNKPLVERMSCTPGSLTCEDDVTYIQCAPDNWAYRKFCGAGFKCVMEGSSGTKVNNCVPEKTNS